MTTPRYIYDHEAESHRRAQTDPENLLRCLKEEGCDEDDEPVAESDR